MKVKILLIYLLWRLLLFIPVYFAFLYLPYRTGFAYTSPLHFIDKNNLVAHFLLSPWGNFDGVHYLLIAAYGYTINAGFFPFFPLTINVISNILGSVSAFDVIQFLTALFLANIYFVLALLIFYSLVKIDYKKNIVITSVIFLLVFPTSFFYGAIYSESLFLLLSLASFYFARKRQWFFASIFGSLLTATRIVGIAILPALLWEFFREEIKQFKKGGNKLKLIFKGLPLLIIPLGLLSYMYFNFIKWGNPFYFLVAQGQFANNRSVNSIVFFPQTIYRYLKILFSVSANHFEWWIALLEILTFFIISFLFSIAFKKKIRFSYLIFSLFCFLLPVSSGTFSALPRYSVVLFPLFMALGLVTNKKIKIIYAAISIILLFIALMLFSRGYFIA